MRPRAAWCGVAVVYAVAIVILFWPVVSHGQMCGWDCIDEYWPDLVVQARAARAGEFPYWNPYTLGGYPFYADPQAGVLTPINWLCTLLSFAVGVGPWLVQLKVLLLFYAALLGTHLVMWGWTKSHWASAIAACTFVLGAPTLVHKNSAIVWPLLQLPWAVLALDAFAERPTLRRAGWLGLALAAVGTAHPQGAFYCALVLGPYVVLHIARRAWVLVRDQRGTAGRALLRAAAAVAPGAALALLIAGTWLALVYLPSWSIVADSARTHTGMTWATSVPLRAHALKEIFVPELDASWMQDIYLGPLPLVLGLWLATVRREARFWLGVGVISVVLALGTQAYLLSVLVEHAPGFHLFRIAYRFTMITSFAAAVLAGLGVGVLVATPPTRRHKRVLVALAAAWLIAALAIAGTWHVWGMLVIAAFVAVVLDDTRRQWLLVALALLVAVDLWRASATKLGILQPRPEVARGAELLARMPGIAREWRFHASRHAGTGGTLPVPYHASLVHGVRELSGFPQPLANRRVLHVLAAGEREPGVLAHYNTKYFIGRAPRDASTIPGTPIRVAADVTPLARLYPRAELVPSPLIPGLLAARPPSRVTTALVDPADAPPPLPSEAFAPVDAVLVVRSRTRLVFDIDAPAAGILVVNEVWSPHWRASVDGADVPVFRANYVLRALVVPAGRHRVELAFSAPLYEGSLIAGGLALLVLCGALASRWRVLDRRW